MPSRCAGCGPPSDTACQPAVPGQRQLVFRPTTFGADRQEVASTLPPAPQPAESPSDPRSTSPRLPGRRAGNPPALGASPLPSAACVQHCLDASITERCSLTRLRSSGCTTLRCVRSGTIACHTKLHEFLDQPALPVGLWQRHAHHESRAATRDPPAAIRAPPIPRASAPGAVTRATNSYPLPSSRSPRHQRSRA